MKRVIVDYSKLTNEVLDLLVEKFPDGYDYEDIITFQNAKNETVKAVEVKTEDIIYLVKIGLKLEQKMEDYSEEEEQDEDESMTEIPDEQNLPDEF